MLKLVEESLATWIGFGGSRGAAKSGGTRRVNLYRRFKYPKTKGIIFRRTYDEVRTNHIDKYLAEWPELRDMYNRQNREITLPNGSVIAFGYAEHKGDIYKFQGQEFMDIFPDEATHWEEHELNFLKTCNRWPGMADRMCKMIMTMNPGNIGHAFIKRIFFDKAYRENERAEDYNFIQAYGWDNVEWVRSALEAEGFTESDFYRWEDKKRFDWFVTKSDYGRSLNNLPEAMRIGHLLGRWDIFAGQYFDIFSMARHCFETALLGLKNWHRRWASIDWGYAHNAAIYWHSKEGRVTKTYREYVTKGTGPRELAKRIVEQSRLESGEQEKLSAIYLSPDAFAKRTDESPISEQLSDVFRENGLPSCTPASNDRIGGWMKMYEGLKYDEWIISNECKELIKTLPSLTRDDEKLEDCVKFGGDDAVDSARYGVFSDCVANPMPRAERIALAVEEMQKIVPAKKDGIVDYNIVAMQTRIAEARDKKKTTPGRRQSRRFGPPRHDVAYYR